MRTPVSGIAACLLFALSAEAADAPRTTTAELVCGETRLRTHTVSVAHVAPDDGLVWTSQDVTLGSGSQAPRPLAIPDVAKTPADRDNEHRNLVGDNEHRNLVGDNEHRALVGDTEQRNLVGDNEHRNLVGGLSAVISSWQCLQSSQGKVIELWLTCGRADLAGTCGGQREWARLLDLAGRPLDVGYMPQDPRYEALFRRLGVAEDGVRLDNAVGD